MSEKQPLVFLTALYFSIEDGGLMSPSAATNNPNGDQLATEDEL